MYFGSIFDRYVMMFYVLTYLFLSLSFQQNSALDQKIANSFKGNDSKTLATQFSERLEVSVLEQSGIYSKNQAEQIFKTFFVAHRIKQTSLIHRTTEQNNDRFLIIQLIDIDGIPYVLQISFNSNWLIQRMVLSKS